MWGNSVNVVTIVGAGILGFCIKQEDKYILKPHLDLQWDALIIYLVCNMWNYIKG